MIRAARGRRGSGPSDRRDAPTPAPRHVLDVADYLDASVEALCADVLGRVHGVAAPAVAAAYAGRIAALGLEIPQAMRALASIIPGTQVPDDTAIEEPSEAAAVRISDAALRGLLAVCDPSLQTLIERIVQTLDPAVALPASAGGTKDDGPVAAPQVGRLVCTPSAKISAAAYLTPTRSTSPHWRSGMVSTMADIAYLAAARTGEAGLLLGPNMVFQGRFLDGESDELPPGWVLFGPRIDLAAGRYRLDVGIRMGSADEVLLDVVSNGGLRKLAELDLRGTTHLNLGFRVDERDREIEVRLVNLGERAVTARIDRLIIRRC